MFTTANMDFHFIILVIKNNELIRIFIYFQVFFTSEHFFLFKIGQLFTVQFIAQVIDNSALLAFLGKYYMVPKMKP